MLKDVPATPFDRDTFASDPILGPILEEIEEMMMEFDRLMQESGAGRVVRGYSITIGTDGQPVVRQFGNVKYGGGGVPQATDAYEPLVDVVDRAKDVKVIAEIPGVKREDIAVAVKNHILEISVGATGRKYYKRVKLPSGVVAKPVVTYNNGILDVTLKKAAG